MHHTAQEPAPEQTLRGEDVAETTNVKDVNPPALNGVNGTKDLGFVAGKANPALFTNEKREIFMGDSPPLNPGPNDCVVRMRCNGICGLVGPQLGHLPIRS